MKTFMCAWCAQSFQSSERQPHPPPKYCCHRHATNAKRIPAEAKVCEYCGNTFYHPDRNTLLKQRFCSKSCAGRGRDPRNKTKDVLDPTCLVCHIPIRVNWKTKRKDRRKYCSQACVTKGRQSRRRAPLTKYQYLQYGREYARDYLPDECAICGWHEAHCDSAHLDIHTLVRLCPNHHRLLDHGKLPMSTVLALSEKAIRYNPY